MIGGLAAQAHGSPLITEDLDICFDLDHDNLERLASVLRDLAAVRRGLPDASASAAGSARRCGRAMSSPCELALATLISWRGPTLGWTTSDFDRTRLDSIPGARVWMADLDDLIAMKRAAGRPKDLLAIEHLAALREEIDLES